MASMEKEFFWGCQLNKDKREYQWDSEDEKLSKLDIDQKLLLSNACLGAEVKENDQNLIEVTTTDVSENKATFTIVSLKKGSTEQCRLNLTFPSTVLFRLVEGSGPVHLVGSVYQELFLSESEESESEEGEDSVIKTKQVSSKKRPLVSDTPKGPPRKQARVEKENDKEMEIEDDDDEDDDDEDDDDEDNDNEDDDNEDDDNEDDDEEDETSIEETKETPEKPKKPEPTPKSVAAGKKAIAKPIENKKAKEEEVSKDNEREEEDEEEGDEEESGEESEGGSDEDDDEEQSEDEESKDEVAAILAAQKKETGKGGKKPVANGVGKPEVGKKLKQAKQVQTPKQEPSAPKGKTPEGKKSGGKTPQTEPSTPKGKTPEGKKSGVKTPQTPDQIKEKLLKTTYLPKKVEKFKNYMKSSFKMTDDAAITEMWDWLQKNKK